ncbi:MAG: radical SAM protein [Deltaproteobacteria bacterium]|nr:radical SAM protein [Deltaproteobacteria bacterium]
MTDRPELLGLNESRLAEVLGGSGRAREVKKLVAKGIDPFDALDGRARRRLVERLSRTVLQHVDESVSEDGTTKLLLGLRDGLRVECVLIPSLERTTLCVSTQVGCARGCVFCQTARMGLTRNLTMAEIVGQLFVALPAASKAGIRAPTNVVFMGMGEPLDNADAVEAAVHELIDHRSFAIAARRVTVSTVGPSPKAIARTKGWPISLAWSLHSAREEVRRKLVPTARHSPLELRDAFVALFEGSRRHLFVEITLIDGLNDGLDDADAVADLLEHFAEPRVNLLPVNPSESRLLPAKASAIDAFAARLSERGIFTIVRRARGEDALAACGQLATESGRRESGRDARF